MVTLHNSCIPMVIKYRGNLKLILTKAEQHCVSQGLNPEEMIKLRLVEDMRSLDYQVQSCSNSNTAKFISTRLAQPEDVFFEDSETTFPQLQSRIDRTVDVLEAVNGSEDAEVMLESEMGDFKFTGYSCAVQYACPNFHFHLSSACCILRRSRVPLAAFDYLDLQKDLFVQAEKA